MTPAWHDAVRAASLLMHALDARNSTQCTQAVEGAAYRLQAAGLVDLAEEACELAWDWQCRDIDIKSLLAAVDRAVERLKRESEGREAAA